MSKSFEEYLLENIARKITSNKERANSLIEDSDKREEFLKEAISKIEITDNNANYFIEEVYDILISLIRAKMLINGYMASGNYAHEAEVSYLIELKFTDYERNIMDEIRKFRNGIKYYGKRYKKEEAEKTLNFMNSILPKLKNLLKNATK